MKILVCGHSGHGKGEFCKLLGLSTASSSEVATPYVFERWGYHHYATEQECHADRRNFKQKWFGIIQEFNAPDRTALARMVLKDHDVYDGMRCVREFDACREAQLFDLTVWVDASERVAPQDAGSCTITQDMCGVLVTNNEGLDLLALKARTFISEYLP